MSFVRDHSSNLWELFDTHGDHPMSSPQRQFTLTLLAWSACNGFILAEDHVLETSMYLGRQPYHALPCCIMLMNFAV